jgi:hypothetical protein
MKTLGQIGHEQGESRSRMNFLRLQDRIDPTTWVNGIMAFDAVDERKLLDALAALRDRRKGKRSRGPKTSPQPATVAAIAQ